MASANMTALELVGLNALMERGTGRPEVTIGLIDGPVASAHPSVEGRNIRALPGANAGGCSRLSSAACRHGTFVAAILLAKRDSVAPAICPGCSLLVRPIFTETVAGSGHLPSATPRELAAAMVE